MNKAEKIWNEYSRLMLYIARGFFGDTPDAEDAVSEAVERILVCLDQFGDLEERCRGVAHRQHRARFRLRCLYGPGRQGQGHGRCQEQCCCFSCEMVFSDHCVPF